MRVLHDQTMESRRHIQTRLRNGRFDNLPQAAIVRRSAWKAADVNDADQSTIDPKDALDDLMLVHATHLASWADKAAKA